VGYLYSKVELEKIKMQFSQRIPVELIDQNFDLAVELTTQMLIANVRGYLLGEQAGHTEIRCPEDWWQAFKARWFPVWLLKKYPVTYRVHTIDAKLVYPNFKPSLPRESNTFIFPVYEEPKILDYQITLTERNKP
jgi:hypothetical protein